MRSTLILIRNSILKTSRLRIDIRSKTILYCSIKSLLFETSLCTLQSILPRKYFERN